MKTDVLIVEDDENIRSLYLAALSGAGMRVESAVNGVEGAKKALDLHPGVILMDIMMPEMNGHEATAVIRSDSWGRGAKIIFLTNMSDADDVMKAVEQGSEEYIVKAHADPSEVVNKVRIALHT